MSIRYQPRWKEMFDGFLGDHRFTIEITMGVLHVYFPTEETWERSAPPWAQSMWACARDSAIQWADDNSIPFDIDHAAWVEFEENQEVQQAGVGQQNPP